MTIYDRWSARILLLSAAVLPLLMMFQWQDTFDLPRLFWISSVAAGLCFSWCAAVWRSQAMAWQQSPIDVPLLVFLLVQGVSAWGSIDPSISWTGIYRVYTFGVWPLLSAALLFWVCVQCRDPLFSDRLILAVILSGAVAGFYALLQVMGIELFSQMPKATERPWSSMGNPLYLGAACMIAFLLTLSAWLDHRHDRLLLSVCGAAQLAGLFLSLSRSAWMGVMVGLIVLLRRHRFFGAGVLVFIALLLIWPSTRSRLLSIGNSQEHSNAARLAGWKSALQIWKDHPVLGSGPDTFAQAFRPYRSMDYVRSGGAQMTQAHAHNDILQVLSTTGILGLITCVWLGVRLFRSDIPIGIRAVLVAMCIHNQFNFSSLTTTGWLALLIGAHVSRQTIYVTARRKIGVMAGVVSIAIGVLWFQYTWRPAMADAAFQQGVADRARQQFVPALVQFREAVRLHPSIETYQLELGNMARTLAEAAAEGSLRKDLFQEAWQAALTNTRRHPHNPDAWNNLGVVAMWRTQLGGEDRMADARSAFEKATVLDPHFVDAWANRAKWHHLAGDLSTEKELWQKVLTIHPSHEMARQVLGQTS